MFSSLMEDKKKLLAVCGIIVAVVIGAFYILSAQAGAINVNVEGGGGSGTSVSARPYIDYITEDGRILRVYLDTNEKYWVDPNTGELIPYEQGLHWVVPGTISKIVYVNVGFDVTASGKYLKDIDNDGYMEVTLTITSYFNDNDTDTSDYYYVFNNHQVTVDLNAGPSSSTPGTYSGNIQSGNKDIQTIFDTVWGESPVQEGLYYPKYSVSVTVNATSVWGDNLQKSASKTYDHSQIGSWQWKVAELGVSLGSASASTQSVLSFFSSTEGFLSILVAIGIIMFIVLVAKRED